MATSTGRPSGTDKSSTRATSEKTPEKTTDTPETIEVQTNAPAETAPTAVPTDTSVDPDNPVTGYTTHEPVPGSEGPRSQLELDQQQ